MVKSKGNLNAVSLRNEPKSTGMRRGREFLAVVLVVIFAIALVNVLNIQKENAMIGDGSLVSEDSYLTGAVPGDAGTILWGDDTGEKCKRTGWQGGYTYKLTRDFSGSDLDSNTKSCFLINAQNVVLDCAGKTIKGLYPYFNTKSQGVLIAANGIVVKNCKIQNFFEGIRFRSRINYAQSLFNTVKTNKYGIIIDSNAKYNIIGDNEITDNGNSGIWFSSGASSNKVQNTISCRNTLYDIDFRCTAGACLDTSGTKNFFTNITPNDGSPSDDWPVLHKDYELCSTVQCNNAIDDDGDTKVDATYDSKCVDTKDIDESPKDNCVDTDVGTDPVVKGTVSGWTNDAAIGPYTDYCEDQYTLNEYYCGDKLQDYDWFSKQFDCVSSVKGGRCENGACISSYTCDNFCRDNGYGSGDCDSMPAQCSANGGIWGKGGDQYCVQQFNDPAADTCCCYN